MSHIEPAWTQACADVAAVVMGKPVPSISPRLVVVK